MAVETKAHKVLLSLVGRTLVEHTTLINNHYLVHKLVDTLSGLVQSDESCALAHIGHDTQGLGVIQSGAGVEPSSRVVPADNGGFCGQRLSNTDTLTLTTGDSTDVLVTHSRVLGVSDTKHLK